MTRTRRRALATLLLLVAASHAHAQGTIHVVPAGGAEGFGHSLSRAGDLDGDGIQDLLSGAPSDDTAGNSAGRVAAFSGATGAMIFEAFGFADGHFFGTAVAALGDVDGDGAGEVIVGTQRAYVRVVSSAGGALVHHIDDPDGIGYFGRTVLGIPDVDGDAVPDFLVASRRYPGFGVERGRVYVYSGVDASVITTLDGTDVREWFGDVLALVGDVDADGVEDWCVGSPPHERVIHGKLRVYSGASMGVLFDYSGLYLGGVVGAAGDVDGDGHGDLLIGVPGYSTFATNNGRVDVRSGATGALIHQVYGPYFSQLGSAVGALGDANGDGFDDFLVAAARQEEPGNDLEDAGGVHLFSGADASVLFTRWGEEPTANFGFALASLGDVDADAVPDFVVSSPGLDHTPVAGELTVVSGTCGGLTHFTYCVGGINSTGVGASIGFLGSTSVSADDLVLTVDACPPNKPGLFFFGQMPGFAAFGDGFLCTRPPYIRIRPVLFTDSQGRASLDIDFQHTEWSVLLRAGSTPNFQFWYRDPHGPGGSGTNSSNALGLVLCR